MLDPEQPDTDHTANLTSFLNELGQGPDGGAEAGQAEWMPKVVEELQQLARYVLGGGTPDQTLHPTALVNATYLKLFGANPSEWSDRRHILRGGGAGDAAGGNRSRAPQGARQARRGDRCGDAGQGLGRLGEERSGAAGPGRGPGRAGGARRAPGAVVELRLFAGLEVEQVAQALGVSEATVECDWRFARAWLMNRIA